MQYIEVGAGLGRIVGIDVGGEDGVTVGTVVGAGVGSVVGIVVGTAVGVVVGIASTLRFISSSANTRCADRASVRVERLLDDRATQAVFVFFTSSTTRAHHRTSSEAPRALEWPRAIASNSTRINRVVLTRVGALQNQRTGQFFVVTACVTSVCFHFPEFVASCGETFRNSRGGIRARGLVAEL